MEAEVLILPILHLLSEIRWNLEKNAVENEESQKWEYVSDIPKN